MRFFEHRYLRLIGPVLVFAVCFLGGLESAQGELYWQQANKQSIRVRLVAMAASYPRSSTYSNQEVFVAAQEIGPGELRLVKLVYEFLPYQPRLSESGLDYAMVHEVRAVRDPHCDETLAAMLGAANDRRQLDWEYSTDSPGINFSRRRNPLPCYQTSAQDYGKPVHAPAEPSSQF